MRRRGAPTRFGVRVKRRTCWTEDAQGLDEEDEMMLVVMDGRESLRRRMRRGVSDWSLPGTCLLDRHRYCTVAIIVGSHIALG